MANLPNPPATYLEFISRFPLLGEAWQTIGEAGKDGPIDERVQRLIKLAIAIGAMREGAVHSSTRKALALGITPEEINQVIALSAGTLGLPSTVAIYSWIRDCMKDDRE